MTAEHRKPEHYKADDTCPLWVLAADVCAEWHAATSTTLPDERRVKQLLCWAEICPIITMLKVKSLLCSRRQLLKTRSRSRGTEGGNEDRKLNLNRKSLTPFPLPRTSLYQPWCVQGSDGCSCCQFPVDHRYLLPKHTAALYLLGPSSAHSPTQSGKLGLI